MKNNLLIFFILIITWIFWIFSGFIWANIVNQNWNKAEKNISSSNLWNLQNDVIDIVRNISPSVVSIIIKKDMPIYRWDPWGFFRQKVGSINQKIWGWTGFFIRKDWVILTNKHVVSEQNATYTVILSSWEEFDAKVLAFVENTDLAIIKIESKKNFKALNFAKRDSVKIWQFAIAIWNALAEFDNSVSFWVISWLNRKIQDSGISLTWLIQTDTAINPWNSGWPLLNISWEVVWINTAIVSWSQWIWFAIALSEEIIDEILKNL